MIEIVILNFLNEKLDVPAFLEEPKVLPESYVLFEKTSGTKRNHLLSSTFAFQSFAPSLFKTAELNEKVKAAVEDLITQSEISGVKLNSDYNFTDTVTKKYRYQAVFDINHY